jgi:hypothetical protein
MTHHDSVGYGREVEFSKDLSHRIIAQLASREDVFSEGISLKEKDVEREVNLFILKLNEFELYNTDFNKYEVFSECVLRGPSYAKTLKKETQYGFLEAHNYAIGIPKGYSATTKYSSKFPVNHLVFWKEPVVDDLKHSQTEVNISQKNLQEFMDALERILPADVNFEANDNDLFRSMPNSSTYSKDKLYSVSRVKKAPRYSRKYRGVRCQIRVGPANVRDGVKLSPDCRLTITKISKLIQRIVYKMETSAMKSTSAEINAVFDRIKTFVERDEDSYTYVRDFKKEGITKPPQLLKAIQDVLRIKYPQEDWSLMDIYNDIVIDQGPYECDYAKNGKIRLKRGHGLGFANELTTLVQCAVFEMAQTRALSGGLANKIHARFWNDDGIFWGDLDDLVLYRNYDLSVCQDLSLILTHEKTGILKNGSVFCEEYASTFWDCDKQVLTALAITQQYGARNITQAKTCIRSISTLISDGSEEVIQTFRALKSYWGYEFSELEDILPAQFGGWMYYKYMWMDEGLSIAYNATDDDKELQNLYRAEKTSIHYISKVSERKLKKVDLPGKPDYPTLYSVKKQLASDELFNHNAIQMNNHLKNDILNGMSMRYYPDGYWDKLHRERQKEYKKKCALITRVEFCSYVMNNKKDSLIALPEEYILKSEYSKEVKNLKILRLPLLNSTSRLSLEELEAGYLKLLYPEHYASQVTLSPLEEYLARYKLENNGEIRSNFEFECVTDITDFEEGLKSFYRNPFIAAVYYNDILEGQLPSAIDPGITLEDNSLRIFDIPEIGLIKDLYTEIETIEELMFRVKLYKFDKINNELVDIRAYIEKNKKLIDLCREYPDLFDVEEKKDEVNATRCPLCRDFTRSKEEIRKDINLINELCYLHEGEIFEDPPRKKIKIDEKESGYSPPVNISAFTLPVCDWSSEDEEESSEPDEEPVWLP